jgi:hypothetical protein
MRDEKRKKLNERFQSLVEYGIEIDERILRQWQLPRRFSWEQTAFIMKAQSFCLPCTRNLSTVFGILKEENKEKIDSLWSYMFEIFIANGKEMLRDIRTILNNYTHFEQSA